VAADLFRLAVTAMAKAYAPYSGFRVGASIRTEDGRTYSGCNIENVAFPEGWCAETTAIAHMVMDGGGVIAEVCVVGEKGDAITPCGGCRQRIAEFGSPETKIHLCGRDGMVATHTLAELLPAAFVMEQS
jgi:cytidine deaminase